MMRDHSFWSRTEPEESGPYVGRGSLKFYISLRVAEIGRNICFGKGGGSAPAADPQIGAAALMQAKTGEDWLNFAKDQFAESSTRQTAIDALSTRVTEQQLATQDKSNALADREAGWAQQDRDRTLNWANQDRDRTLNWANEDRGWAKDDRAIALDDKQRGRETYVEAKNNSYYAREKGAQYEADFNKQANKQYAFADEQQQRYKNTFQPIEDKLASDSMNWDSAGRQAEMAAQAKGDVYNNADIAQAQQARQMASMGVDPRSGRYDATTRATGLQTALSAAGAQNSARDTTRQQAVSLRGQAAGIGQQVNANAQQANSMGMQATSSAHQAVLNGEQSAMSWQNLGLAAQGIGNSNASLASGGSVGGVANGAGVTSGNAYQGLGLGLQAGTSALNSSIAANQSANSNAQIMNQGFGGAMQGYAGQASALNNQYSNQISAQSVSNQAAQSQGNQNAAIAGTVGTIALAF